MRHKVQREIYNKLTGKIVTIGEAEKRKEEILSFITEHNDGVSESEIRGRMGFSSKQTTYNHLNTLLSKNRVYRKNKKYFAYISGPNSINAFARNIRDASIRLVDADLIDPSEKIIKFLDTQSVTSPYGLLLKNTSGINVSNDFCETKFVPKKDLNKKCMFEFVNRIGSIMAYMFIESLGQSKAILLLIRQYQGVKQAL